MARRERIRDDDLRDLLVDHPTDDDLSDKDLDKRVLILEDKLAIDENGLDDAWKTQPESFYEASKLLALYVSRRDAAKQQLGIAEAEADRDNRNAAAQAGDKITEKELASMGKLDKQVIRANEGLIRLQHKVGVLQALVGAFEQRGKALSGMSSLYTTNYFQHNSAVGGENRYKDYQADSARRGMADERRKRGY